MVIDTSALLAIFQGEAEAARLAAAIAAAPIRLISAATHVEANLVVRSRYGDAGMRDFAALLRSFALTTMPVDERQIARADEAHRRFGRGSGHAAGLNFGDLFSYALARDTAQQLLFKGDDFTHTDISAAAY